MKMESTGWTHVFSAMNVEVDQYSRGMLEEQEELVESKAELEDRHNMFHMFFIIMEFKNLMNETIS